MDLEITNSQSNNEPAGNKPKNVSSHLWEKFKALEKRTNEVTQRSTEKRIRQLQKQVVDTVTKEFTNPKDKKVLEKYDAKLVYPIETKTDNRKRKAVPSSSSSTQSVTTTSSTTAAIDELKDYLDINEHLQQRDYSRPPPATALENKINNAIRSGDFEIAESLSDHLATREMGERIVSAIDAKRFLEQKKVEQVSTKAKRKRKLNWGFEPKHRWETKGNM